MAADGSSFFYHRLLTGPFLFVGFTMKNNVIELKYEDLTCRFTEDAWFNATEVAAKFGKRPTDWLKLDSTKQYIKALAENLRSEESALLKTSKGKGKNGTWFHPRLAVPFARWLNVEFSIWCDVQIDQLIRGSHPHYDWKKLRHEATSSFKVMNEILHIGRDMKGKSTKAHHYMNEAKLVNWAIKGEFKGLDRDALSGQELDLLARLEERNAVLIGRGMEYKDRKVALKVFADDWQTSNIKKIA